MDIKELLKMAEEETGQQVSDAVFVQGGNSIKKEHLRISLSDGKKILIKKYHMSPFRLKEMAEINRLNIDCFQKLLSVHSTDEDEGYLLMEWNEGIPLNDDSYEPDSYRMREDVHKAAKALHHLHETTKTQKIITVTTDDVNTINEKLYLTSEQKRILIDYITSNIHLINGRCRSVTHGDLHLANILIKDSQVVFLDIDDIGYGDPYMDLVYAANLQYTRKEQLRYYLFLQYYFDHEIPDEFWRIVNCYSLIKGMGIIESEIRKSQNQNAVLSIDSLFKEHENMTQQEPNWFLRIQQR